MLENLLYRVWSRQKSFFSNVLYPRLVPAGTDFAWKVQLFFFFHFFCCLSCQQKRRAGKKQKTEFHRKPFCWKMQPELHHHHQVTLMVSTVSRKSQSRKLERVHTVICFTKLHFIFKEMQERKSPLSLLIIICIHTVHKSGAKPSAPSP